MPYLKVFLRKRFDRPLKLLKSKFDLNHYNHNSGGGYLLDNNNQNQNPNRYKNNINIQNNKKDIKNDTMATGWGFLSKNNYNKKFVSGPIRPSTAPQKDKVSHSQAPNNPSTNNLN